MPRLRLVALCFFCAAAGFGAALVVGPRTGPASATGPHPIVFFRARTTHRVVALTFDDGPDPRWTPQVLALLKDHGAHATFFEIGEHAQAHPDLTHAVLAAGDEIGNHTWDHADLEAMTPAQIDAEVEHCSDALRAIGVPSPKYFRPPKGLTDEAVGVIADAHKYRTVFWDVAVEHYVDHDPDMFLAVQTLLAHVRPGSIILAHDGGIPNRARTMRALPMILDGLHARGYRVMDISELLKVANR